jgi:hypothetical protein
MTKTTHERNFGNHERQWRKQIPKSATFFPTEGILKTKNMLENKIFVVDRMGME